jgi:toxin ParE1/3/4
MADAEFIESAEWYEDHRAGLGLKFIDQVQQVLDILAENPSRYPVVFEDIREGLVSEFPFAVYYRVKPNQVVILAVFHCSRDPAVWQARN